MQVFSIVYSIFVLILTGCITGFSLFALVDYFRIRRAYRAKINKECEDIIIDNVSSQN